MTFHGFNERMCNFVYAFVHDQQTKCLSKTTSLKIGVIQFDTKVFLFGLWKLQSDVLKANLFSNERKEKEKKIARKIESPRIY